MKDDTVWLNRQQMSVLFDRDIKTIGKHINNALKEELSNEREVVVAKFATTTPHGAIKSKTQTHFTEYYNLDVVLSVGYRVKSNKGIIFRRWATKILKDYTLKGYAVNQQRLEYLEKTVKLIDIAGRLAPELAKDDAKEILSIIANYSKALNLLDDYDHHSIKKIEGNVDNRKITYQKCIEIIEKLKANVESSFFGAERNRGLESIINNIYQNFNNEDVYKSVEEKAANLLYLVVKNHVFTDGNKRIAATLFIYFLNFYGILYQNDELMIDNNMLAALTLLIAESHPAEKATLIGLVMNFLVKK